MFSKNFRWGKDALHCITNLASENEIKTVMVKKKKEENVRSNLVSENEMKAAMGIRKKKERRKRSVFMYRNIENHTFLFIEKI